MSKTLFLFQEAYFVPKFFELEGDYSHLHRTYINGCHPDEDKLALDDPKLVQLQEEYAGLCDELNELVYTEDGKLKVTFLDKPTKDWDHYVECGFIP